MRKQQGSLSIEYYSIFPMHCSWAMRPANSLTKRPITQLSRPGRLSIKFANRTRNEAPKRGHQDRGSPPEKEKKKERKKEGGGRGGSVLSV